MAKAPAKPEVAVTPDAPAPKKSKLLLVIVVILVLLLLVAMAFIGVLLLLKSKGGSHDGEPAPVAAPAQQAAAPMVVDLSKPPAFVPLEVFTVNLAREGNSDHYLQTTIVLRVADAKVATQITAFMPEIRHRINLLLSSKAPSEIATAQDREALAHDVLIQVNEALGIPAPRDPRPNLPWGPVHGVLFNSFIVQ
ncbi:flagellar basal body protein FliL [Pseudothauera nasutitermitis]|uniref:Flagellar protein FliL n=1 Tax=Pseudothauera nasutitermitis TaxID=2565930 RepID=A0A4S4AZU4_9RHOO|nr:flagellar basal body-associated FliL family protein [Pseudothauera nasutitermitis]THF65713.1 flagellar basal body protein FliL [Pseudothauera nasutitermitis]